jgi:hypothetical protein
LNGLVDVQGRMLAYHDWQWSSREAHDRKESKRSLGGVAVRGRDGVDSEDGGENGEGNFGDGTKSTWAGGPDLGKLLSEWGPKKRHYRIRVL